MSEAAYTIKTHLVIEIWEPTLNRLITNSVEVSSIEAISQHLVKIPPICVLVRMNFALNP